MKTIEDQESNLKTYIEFLEHNCSLFGETVEQLDRGLADYLRMTSKENLEAKEYFKETFLLPFIEQMFKCKFSMENFAKRIEYILDCLEL